LNLNQTTHLKNLNATAWVHKHISTLIFDFKFIKIIIILSLHAHKYIHKKSYFPIFLLFKFLGCYNMISLVLFFRKPGLTLKQRFVL
jgi:hypothetical protein